MIVSHSPANVQWRLSLWVSHWTVECCQGSSGEPITTAINCVSSTVTCCREDRLLMKNRSSTMTSSYQDETKKRGRNEENWRGIKWEELKGDEMIKTKRGENGQTSMNRQPESSIKGAVLAIERTLSFHQPKTLHATSWTNFINCHHHYLSDLENFCTAAH